MIFETFLIFFLLLLTHCLVFDTLKEAQTEIKQLQGELEQRDNAVELLMNRLDKQRREFSAKKAIYKWKDCLKQRKIDQFSQRLADRHYAHTVWGIQGV